MIHRCINGFRIINGDQCQAFLHTIWRNQSKYSNIFQHFPYLFASFPGIFLWKLSLPSLTRPNWPSASLQGLQGLQLEGLPCGSGQICISTVSTRHSFQWTNVPPKSSACAACAVSIFQDAAPGHVNILHDKRDKARPRTRILNTPVDTWSYRALHHASKSASMAPAWGEKNRVPNLSGPGFHISTVANKCKEYSVPPILGPRDWKMHARHQDLIKDVDTWMNLWICIWTCVGAGLSPRRAMAEAKLSHWRITNMRNRHMKCNYPNIEHGSYYLIAKSATHHAACNRFQKSSRK